MRSLLTLALLLVFLVALLPGPAEASLKRQKNDVARTAKGAGDGVGSKTYSRLNGVPKGSIQTKAPDGRRKLAQTPPLQPQPPPMPSQQQQPAPLNATGVASPLQESQGLGQAMSRGGRHTGGARIGNR